MWGCITLSCSCLGSCSGGAFFLQQHAGDLGGSQKSWDCSSRQSKRTWLSLFPLFFHRRAAQRVGQKRLGIVFSGRIWCYSISRASFLRVKPTESARQTVHGHEAELDTVRDFVVCFCLYFRFVIVFRVYVHARFRISAIRKGWKMGLFYIAPRSPVSTPP